MARLVALDERTRAAWAHPHNKLLHVTPRVCGCPEYDANRHECTRVHRNSDSDSDDGAKEPELRLCFDIRPKDISKGWIFGSDRSMCDVYCGEDGGYCKSTISEQIFLITMSKQGNVILKHIQDTDETQVQYGNQKAGRRGIFVWTMLPDCSSIIVNSSNLLEFRVLVAMPSHQTESYKAFRTGYLADVEKSLPSVPFPSVDNERTAADTSLVPTSEPKPFYYRREEEMLGCGFFGAVFVVVDVSTTIEYAGIKYISLSMDDNHMLVTEYIKGYVHGGMPYSFFLIWEQSGKNQFRCTKLRSTKTWPWIAEPLLTSQLPQGEL